MISDPIDRMQELDASGEAYYLENLSFGCELIARADVLSKNAEWLLVKYADCAPKYIRIANIISFDLIEG